MAPNKRKYNVSISQNSSSQKGFALVAAIMACLILLALAMLVIQLSTQDLRISSRTVGEKKAVIAAETGINVLLQNFDPSIPGNFNVATSSAVEIDAVNAPGDKYTISTPAGNPPARGPSSRQIKRGYAIGGEQSWCEAFYTVEVTGMNSIYNTRADISVGIGYSPVPCK